MLVPSPAFTPPSTWNGAIAKAAMECTSGRLSTKRRRLNWTRSSPTPGFNRGLLWYEVGDFPQSIADLAEVNRLNPKVFFSRSSLSYLFNDQPKEAQADMSACEEIRLWALR